MKSYNVGVTMVIQWRALWGAVVMGAALMAHVGGAATATWTNTANGTVANWSAAGNWNDAYPGSGGPNEGAYLTNTVPGSVYKTVIDASTSLPDTLGTLEIRNFGANGEAWVIVTNALVASTSLILRTRGCLEIDNLGVVTNVQKFTMDGTNGQILVGSGGTLFVSNNIIVGGLSNTVSLGDNSVLAMATNLTFGATGSRNQLLIPGSNVRMRMVINPAFSIVDATVLVTGEGTLWDCGGNNQCRLTGSGATMIISQGSLILTNHSTFNVGYFSASSNSLIVTNGGRLFTRNMVGAGSGGSNHVILVTGNGSCWDNNGSRSAVGNDGARNNRMIVDNGATVSNASVYVGFAGMSANDNLLLITNGSRWVVGSAGSSYYNSVGAMGTNNLAVVTGNGSLWELGTRTLYVGPGVQGSVNGTNAYATLRVESGGAISNGVVVVGGGASSIGNLLAITNGASAYLTSLSVGMAGSQSNTVWLSAGCLLQANTLTNGAPGSGNIIMNDRGVFQFTSPTPTIGSSGGGGIVVSNGTISFSSVAAANVKGNWSGTQLINLSWGAGSVNAFRLNNATNGSATVQDYLFDTGLGETNYARLEMTGAKSAYTNGTVTTGSGGALVISNTSAIFWKAVTNNGSMRIIDSTVVFKQGLRLGEDCQITTTSNLVGNTITVVGTLSLPVNASLTNSFDLERNQQAVLFSADTITGSPANWSIVPSSLHVGLSPDGKQVVIRPSNRGFLFIVE